MERYDLKRWGGWVEDSTVTRYIDEARTRKRQIQPIPVDEISFFRPTGSTLDVVGAGDILVRMGFLGSGVAEGQSS